MMVDAMGAENGTFARVTGAFFIGLSLGAWFGASRQPGRPWLAVAVAEGAVGGLCLVPIAVTSSASVMRVLEFFHGIEWILPLVLIAPAAFAMGVAFPWMVCAAQSSGSRTVILYALNTAGAVLGIVAVMGFALPELGLATTAWVLVSINGVIACSAAAVGVWDRASGKVDGISTPEGVVENRVTLDKRLAVVAFASGFLILSQEVTLQHQFSQILINSLFSSAAVLMVVLTVLAGSAVVAPWVGRCFGGPARAMPWICLLAAGGATIQPFLLVWQRDGLNFLPYQWMMPAYLWNLWVTAILSSGFALFFAGLIFPLVLESSGGMSRGAGKLLAWNGFGGLLGAEMSSLVLAPIFGLWKMMIWCACGYLWLSLGPVRPPKWAVLVMTLGIAIGAWLAGPLPFAALQSGETLLAKRVAPEGVVCVVRRNALDTRILFNNSYSLGGTKAQVHQERQGLLPGLLHGNPRRVATLGVATGSTVAGVSMLPGVESIDAIELSPTVIDFAREHFRVANRGVLDDERVNLILGDARKVLSKKEDTYDLIIGDLFLPWRTGEGRLFSLEHFQGVRRALRKDGIFCQWLPMFQLTEKQFDTILRTFQIAFPEGFLIRGDFFHSHPILGLVGGRGIDELPWNSMDRQTRWLRESDQSRDPLMRHADGVRMLLLGPTPRVSPGPVNTLANAWLEWDAGRNIIGMKQPWFRGRPFEYFLESIDPGSTTRLIPESLMRDEGADWESWPGVR